jgi:hypothetical protein
MRRTVLFIILVPNRLNRLPLSLPAHLLTCLRHLPCNASSLLKLLGFITAVCTAPVGLVVPA